MNSTLSQRASATRAHENILNKIQILKYWQKNGIPYRKNKQGYFYLNEKGHKELDFVPRSLREFNKWNPSYNEEATTTNTPHLANITSNGTDTLNKRPDLKILAKGLISTLQQIHMVQALSSDQSKTEDFKQQLNKSDKFINTLNKELVIQYKEISKLNRLLSKLTKQKESQNRHMTNELERLKSENIQLIHDKALLTQQLSKITPLKKA